MVEAFVVIFVSILQSVFGVGVLLFGTPIFLLLGFDFIETLITLLPISFAINVLQIYPRLGLIERELITKTCIISLPLTFGLLILISKFNLDIAFIMGLILILFSLKSFVRQLNNFFNIVTKLSIIPYISIGIVHGISNLGGSILAMLVQANCYDKTVKRTNTAAIYSLLATTQLLALVSAGVNVQINYWLIAVGIIVYLITNKFVFNNIDNSQYERAFSVFLFLFGLVLLVK